MKTLSNQAQVAKLCREFLKSKGIKCRATSDSFSMGDSVGVTVYDQSPETMRTIHEELDKYQSGHFDGMSDMYEYSNSRDDIPQTKYLSIDNSFSPELYQSAYDFLRAKYPGNAEGKPERYEDARRMSWCDNAPHYMDIEQEIYRLLRGSGFGLDAENSREFWATRAHQIPANTAEPCEGVTVREGTRPGFSEIVFPTKPAEDIREELKAAGFRWSRYNGVWYGKSEAIPARYR